MTASRINWLIVMPFSFAAATSDARSFGVKSAQIRSDARSPSTLRGRPRLRTAVCQRLGDDLNSIDAQPFTKATYVMDFDVI